MYMNGVDVGNNAGRQAHTRKSHNVLKIVDGKKGRKMSNCRLSPVVAVAVADYAVTGTWSGRAIFSF